VVALGNFDGLHLGHGAIIGTMLQRAQAEKKPSAVLTFEPHPRRVLRPDAPVFTLLPFHEKARRLRETGVDMLRVVRFTPAFAQTSAEAFVTGLLHGALGVSHVVTGEDFVFGHKRGGDADFLRHMSAKLGFGYTACPQVEVSGERSSSTRIRALLAGGDMREAALLLGRPYSITGRVREGDKRGRLLGFPTLNILPAGIFTPATGVYAVRAKIGAMRVDGVANLGTRPTFKGTRLQLEVHLFDWKHDIYGERVEIAFIERIREEKKFDGLEALKKQIAEDSARARSILTGTPYATSPQKRQFPGSPPPLAGEEMQATGF
jgi:riboflavin kinase/FMN adenylyltransferase